ncbi:Lrp/AsnC family transcriptional regulator [Halorubellus sp. JP-L1]|uniref:Lrp/AsnC family transcriptional regulator n=1 Tax=Halorubellus sp. JP-L1 TaxID=2715753 RepID=UPI00140D5140|nr:Lrp/AsnC family transcriptional regulator [Halorubellus sp. JP-L1]NHN40386.1 Lrp/AsnC family transcriptional regulator [Halorubellus sp. JP-L1]
MRDLDDTDLDILRLLVEDARRPYSEIADRVNVSPPTVSDRVERLADLGVINRFTIDIDRSLISRGIPVLVELDLAPDADDRVAKRLADAEPVEHVYRTAENRIVANATVPAGDVRKTLRRIVDMELVEDVDVSLLEEYTWDPQVADGELSLSCVECGDAVSHEGVTTQFEGDLFHFCGDDCHATFEDRYSGLPNQT